MRTVVLAALVVLAGTLALGGSTVAAQPDRQPTVYASFEDNSCGFPVLFSFPASNRTTTTFYDRDGNVTRIQETGRLAITLTNEANSNSLSLAVSGPVRISVADGTFTAVGRGVGSAPETGVAGLVLVAGKIEVAGGTFVGHATALCPILAGTAAPAGKPAGPTPKPGSTGAPAAGGPAAGQGAGAPAATSDHSNQGQGQGQGQGASGGSTAGGASDGSNQGQGASGGSNAGGTSGGSTSSDSAGHSDPGGGADAAHT